MKIENTTTYLLTKVTNQLRSGLEKRLKEIGLHSGQVFVMFELWQDDGLSQIDLARRLNLTPPTIYKMVRSLEQNGFLKCSSCKQDKRVMRVFLTSKGTEHQSIVQEKWLDFEKNFFEGHNETERLMFYQLLDKIKL